MHFQDKKTIKPVFMKLTKLKQRKIEKAYEKRELTVTVEGYNEDLSL